MAEGVEHRVTLELLTSLGISFDQTRMRTRVEETPWLTT